MTALITRDELRAAIETGEVTVVDALPAAYFAQQHLPGAVNLVVDEADARAADLLPDRNAPIVTYCSNAACRNSEASRGPLTRLGYTDVRKYREGIQDWVEAGLPVESGTPARPLTGRHRRAAAAHPRPAAQASGPSARTRSMTGANASRYEPCTV